MTTDYPTEGRGRPKMTYTDSRLYIRTINYGNICNNNVIREKRGSRKLTFDYFSGKEVKMTEKID